jgi:hypothetical protein
VGAFIFLARGKPSHEPLAGRVAHTETNAAAIILQIVIKGPGMGWDVGEGTRKMPNKHRGE